jgi:hypothetical protein
MTAAVQIDLASLLDQSARGHMLRIRLACNLGDQPRREGVSPDGAATVCVVVGSHFDVPLVAR